MRETMTPRRVQLQQMKPAELAIRQCMELVESLGADMRLTDAVVLLGAAKDSVSDFIDGVKKRRFVYEDLDARGARRLAEEAAALIRRGVVGTRSPIADALLDFAPDLCTMTPPTEAAGDSIATPITAADWHGVAQQYAEEAADLKEQIAGAVERREEVCIGCDSHRIAAIRSVIAGRIACCPDCSTLTMGERNSIREAVKDRLAAETTKAAAGREVTEAMVDAARDVLEKDYAGRVLFSRPTIHSAVRAALAAERGREGANAL